MHSEREKKKKKNNINMERWREVRLEPRPPYNITAQLNGLHGLVGPDVTWAL